MKIRYNKLQTKETEKGKELKLSFSGSINMIELSVVVSGEENEIKKFMQENSLNTFGQHLDIEISNDQQTL